MYRMALDMIPNTTKELRYKIMRNIGHASFRMGAYQDAIQSYEEVMDGNPDFQVGATAAARHGAAATGHVYGPSLAGWLVLVGGLSPCPWPLASCLCCPRRARRRQPVGGGAAPGDLAAISNGTHRCRCRRRRLKRAE